MVKNSRSTSMVLSIEPEGLYWEVAPGDAIQILFDKQEDFWEHQPMTFADEGVILSSAPGHYCVFLVTQGESHELYPQQEVSRHHTC